MAYNKRWCLFLIIIIIIITFVFLLPQIMRFTETDETNAVAPPVQQAADDSASKYQEIVEQRNNVSRLADDLAKKLHQLECANAPDDVSSSGGWCAKSVETKHIADDGLINDGLKTFLAGKRVVSFGDGPGEYKVKLQENVSVFDAYDGAPFIENQTKGLVKHMDLSIPQYGLPVYDWVMSLEVAEHIPAEFESKFLDNLVRHAREGIILSWAVPGQGGHSHVNNQPLDYVEKRMKELCFDRNVIESDRLKGAATLSWLKANVNVYRRKVDDDFCEIDESLA